LEAYVFLYAEVAFSASEVGGLQVFGAFDECLGFFWVHGLRGCLVVANVWSAILLTIN